MKAFFLVLISLCFAAFLTACASLAPKYDDQDFVPRKDLRVVHLVREGLDFYARSRYFEAEARLRQALYLQPDLENVKLSLAVVLENEGLFQEALQLLDELSEEKPMYVKYILARAHVYISAGRYRDAMKSYEQAFDLIGEDPGETYAGKLADVSLSLSVLAYRIGLEEEAICYSTASLTAARNAILVARHIRLLNALGYHKQAVEALGVSEDGTFVSQDPMILTQAAITYFSLDNYEESTRLAERALESLTIDAQGETEMKLIQSVMTYLEEKENPLTEEELSDLSEEEEEEREERTAFLASDLAFSSDAVYWPVPLVSHLAEIQAEIEESGALDDTGIFEKLLHVLGLRQEKESREKPSHEARVRTDYVESPITEIPNTESSSEDSVEE